uniref:Leucine-rich repeat and IQ domain-containing protein 1 n=1 Tax=Xenopus tropicalis TaxID=8364 RepID=A0A6I8SQB0_XENTR
MSWLEDEGIASPGDEDEEQYESGEENENDKVKEELPESVLSYFNLIKKRSKNTEKLILQDLETDNTWLCHASKRETNYDSSCLAELASEHGEEAESLKRRVLAAIEEEEKKEKSYCAEQKYEDNPDNRIFQGDVVAENLECENLNLNLGYTAMEERCRQSLLQWEKEENAHNEMKRKMLAAEKEMLHKQIQEQEKRIENWKSEFQRESSLLQAFHDEQKKKLCEVEMKNQNELTEEMKRHEDFINKIQKDLEKEKSIYEEQKARARKHLEDLYNKSAVKIQAVFRAHLIYKRYAPVLKYKKEERKGKKEQQLKLENEKKEMDQKIRLKLEEKRQKEVERKEKHEYQKRIAEEMAIQESLKQKLRQQEYEKKKKEEKQRLEKVKLLSQLELNGKETDTNNVYLYKAYTGEDKEGTVKHTKESHYMHQDKKNTAVKEVVGEDNTDIQNSQIVPVILVADIPGNKLGIVTTNLSQIKTLVIETLHANGSAMEKVLHTSQKSTEGPDGQSTTLAGDKPLSVEMSGDYSAQCPTLAGDKPLSVEMSGDYSAQCPTLAGDKLLSVETSGDYSAQCPTLAGDKLLSVETSGDYSAHCPKVHSNKTPEDEHNYQLSVSNQQNEVPMPEERTAKRDLKEQKSINHEQSDNSLMPPSARALVLTDHIEQKRLWWMKTCKPWSKILRENNKKSHIKKTKQRKSFMVKKLHPINEDLILNNSPWHDLKQVTTVTLHDLPGCSLTTLSKCTKLKYLSLRCCGLTALEGISDCKDLHYIDVQQNSIQVVQCENLENLYVLLLNKNQITSIHGIDNCKNLRSLELSYNSITRIGDLESLKNLQRLTLDHNQLISTKGLEVVSGLMYLDCSYNYLTELEGIKNCGLLQILKLQGNNLCEPPKLDNHVLLQELYLDDNSISTMETMPSYWLPLLQTLSVSRNSLIHLAPLNSFISLEELDISSNCVSDLQSTILWLEGCGVLRKLYVGKNPLVQEANWRCSLLKHLPGLRFLNDEHTQGKEKVCISHTGNFFNFCQEQISTFRKLWEKLNSEGSAAIVIQRYWRGYVVRRDISYYTRLHEAASVIQTAWHSYCARKNVLHRKIQGNPQITEIQHRAATHIQAVWKGFYFRKKLAAALAAVERDELEDDFEEVNLDDFVFDESALEREWTLASSQFSPETHHYSCKPEQAKIPMTYSVSESKKHLIPWPPHQAWQCIETERKGQQCQYERANTENRLEKQTLSHTSSMKSNADISSKSEKEEKISQEWGFKNSSTAQLMLKRAQKMKSKQARNRKLLDPAVRLALFKNNENKHLPVKPPKKIQQMREEYFQGGVEELFPADEGPSAALESSKEFTYQWLHTQCGDFELTSSRIAKGKLFLPELNHDVLNGGRVQLVANGVSKEALDLDLISVKSGSTLTRTRKNGTQRQYSAGSSNREVVTPIKTGSGPHKKERISFRDSPVQLSGGWGRGKKRGKNG